MDDRPSPSAPADARAAALELIRNAARGRDAILDLSGLSLVVLPDEIGEATSLEVLDLSFECNRGAPGIHRPPGEAYSPRCHEQ